jgi:pimeloyl-ACP methyl ester carboxylesterase
MLKEINNIWLESLTIAFLLAIQSCFSFSYGQDISKNKGKVNGQTFSYYAMKPLKETKGILILLPGWGESLPSIFKKTSLPHLLAEKGYLTVVPELRQTLFADGYTVAELNELIKLESNKYNLTEPNLILGGLSAGGAIAIGYAEYLLATDTMTKLMGIFAIDPPLDLERMYASAENKIKYSCGGLIRKEGYFIKSYLENTLGGTPQSKPEQYAKFSPYSASAKESTNAKWLKNTPVRLYAEPDLEFVRKMYCGELQFEDINAFDLERLNMFLLQSGNNKCQYITTQGKGFHSWNIVDPGDCMDWILTLAK